MKRFRLVFLFVLLTSACISPEPLVVEVPVEVSSGTWEYLLVGIEVKSGEDYRAFVTQLSPGYCSPDCKKKYGITEEIFDNFSEILNKFGADGWEVVSLDQTYDKGWSVVFKRPIN